MEQSSHQPSQQSHEDDSSLARSGQKIVTAEQENHRKPELIGIPKPKTEELIPAKQSSIVSPNEVRVDQKLDDSISPLVVEMMKGEIANAFSDISSDSNSENAGSIHESSESDDNMVLNRPLNLSTSKELSTPTVKQSQKIVEDFSG